MTKLLFIFFFSFSAFGEFFVGIGYINMGDKYSYSGMKATQFVTDSGSGPFSFPVNEYLDIEFEKTSSFGSKSGISSSGIALNIGFKFKLGQSNFFYSPEFFANYSPSKVTDLTMIPRQSFTISSDVVIDSISSSFGSVSTVGISSVQILEFLGQKPGIGLGGIIGGFICGIGNPQPCISEFPIDAAMLKPLLEGSFCPDGGPCNIEIAIPEQRIPITYTMPFNVGMVSRTGYDFKNFSASLITGATLTIFDVTQGENKERIYKGRFIAGFGLEWLTGESKNSRLYLDYKYYIPIQKDIEREYDDPVNIGKKTKVVIKNFKAETQVMEIGFKYYFK